MNKLGQLNLSQDIPILPTKISPELLHQFVEQKTKELIEISKIHMELMEFRILTSLMIPQKEIKRVNTSLKEIKKELWQIALDKAKGNEDKAFEIYCTL